LKSALAARLRAPDKYWSKLMQVEPYRIEIPHTAIEDLQNRLRRTRWADDFGNADWRYGVEQSWLKEMVSYWADRFDWRAQEAAMNAWPHFTVEIDGIKIHFLHALGKGPNPKPLLLTHGWPWTFWDFQALIGPLTDPAAHGGEAEDSFDVVIPCLPGFGFSTPFDTPGVDIPRIAELWLKLMRDGLGYPHFGAAGGDWGALVTTQLGHAYPEHLIGVLATLVAFPGQDITAPANFAADEQWMPARAAQALPTIHSHIAVHSHDPQTLAYALADSPVGTAAWLWERRRAWSDCNGDVLSVFDRDALCTLASIYWFTGAIGSSLRLYFEHFKNGYGLPLIHNRAKVIEIPTAFLVFPKDVAFVPHAVAAAATDLRLWRVMASGGHFGPAEKPRETVAALREFFGALCQDGKLEEKA
jgi:pimeloyl-ACP methyl ester carboxylesterase